MKTLLIQRGNLPPCLVWITDAEELIRPEPCNHFQDLIRRVGDTHRISVSEVVAAGFYLGFLVFLHIMSTSATFRLSGDTSSGTGASLDRIEGMRCSLFLIGSLCSCCRVPSPQLPSVGAAKNWVVLGQCMAAPFMQESSPVPVPFWRGSS